MMRRHVRSKRPSPTTATCGASVPARVPPLREGATGEPLGSARGPPPWFVDR